MPGKLCFTVRFLQPFSHGRGDDGEPEWPPSPLRLFQALIAAAAARWNERIRLEYAEPALRWLEGLPAPTIVAATAVQSEAQYRLYVPDNITDLVARSWSSGRDASVADYRTEKDVRPMNLRGETVHYLYPLGSEGCPPLEVLSAAARSITHLGWGMDMVVGNAEILTEERAEKLLGERWQPSKDPTARAYRTPVQGTLAALKEKHQAFLNRIGPRGFSPVPSLTCFALVGYRRETDIPSRPCAAFELWRPIQELAQLPAGSSKFRPFDPVIRTPVVAGMVRHATAELATQMRPFGWTDAQINTFIHGHNPDGVGQLRGGPEVRRFSYLPLPSLIWRPSSRGNRHRQVGSIRRLLVVGPADAIAAVNWLRRALSGRELIDEASRQPTAMLSLIPSADRALSDYLGPAEGCSTWTTVTPVVLPGHDDRDRDRAERLLRRAIVQAGFSAMLAQNAELEWRAGGFLPGLNLAGRYRLPAYLNHYPRYHLRIHWRDGGGNPVNVRGPLTLGAGRYCGLGLLVTDSQS